MRRVESLVRPEWDAEMGDRVRENEPSGTFGLGPLRRCIDKPALTWPHPARFVRSRKKKCAGCLYGGPNFLQSSRLLVRSDAGHYLTCLLGPPLASFLFTYKNGNATFPSPCQEEKILKCSSQQHRRCTELRKDFLHKVGFPQTLREKTFSSSCTAETYLDG